MSLSTYWLMPPRWSSCPQMSSILNQAFGNTDDTQDQTPEGDQHPAEGGIIALAVGPIDTDYDFTPTLLVLASPIPASTTPAQALADSARSMSDQVPGFRMLEDCEWPARPESSRLRTGIYIQGTVPITACQWAWIHSDGANDFLLTATTMTTPTFGDLNEDVLAIIMSLEVRNA